ncbi:MAG TPA: dihydroorotate dehydrogenase electron transfer subunit [Clostridiales bacterium]|jgi:dihydroorotate dehydrogenase electron transfer subunit|nr:dihydroorotate dehydrogenase electron transfer subunit [Clostridiales bacterium]
MAYFQNEFEIVKVGPLNNSAFELIFNAPEIAEFAKPGQFVHILCKNKTLRRPISICEIDKALGNLRIVFDIRGEGTAWLSKRQKGEYIDVLGPLGNGFPCTEMKKAPLFIGGGLGVPPLLEATKCFDSKANAILGFRSEENVILYEDFMASCENVYLTSDDGTCGRKGFVTDVMKELVLEKAYDVVYACGPFPMLKAVSAIADEHDIDCFVSLEERMGCGVGACLVCACQVEIAGQRDHKHVCKDGPVFNAKEVVW